jgi:hypothetical protein
MYVMLFMKPRVQIASSLQENEENFVTQFTVYTPQPTSLG